MTLTTNLSELHSGAVNQVDSEFFELEKFLKDEAKPEEIRIINAALNLRRLDAGVRMVNFHRMLFELETYGSRYSDLYTISNPEHFSTIATDLLDLVRRLRYDILDDGYLRLVRVKMNYQTFKIGIGDEHLSYFLLSHEDLTMKQIEAAVNHHSPFPFRVVNVKTMWFKSLDQFASFLGLLADGFDSKDVYQDKLAKRIDELMKPETYRNWTEEEQQ